MIIGMQLMISRRPQQPRIRTRMISPKGKNPTVKRSSGSLTRRRRPTVFREGRRPLVTTVSSATVSFAIRPATQLAGTSLTEVSNAKFSTPDKNNEGIYGCLDKIDDAANKLHKSDKNIKKYMKAFKNQNMIIYNMAKKTSSCWELHKVKNIKPSYDTYRIYSSESSDDD